MGSHLELNPRFHSEKTVHNHLIYVTGFSLCIEKILRARGSVVVEALCYKPEDREFETR
jgi:hypothetical protein